MQAVPPGFQQVLEAYAARLRSRFGARVRMVRLFGSWARGEAHEESDVDVAAVIDGLTREEWREAVGLAVSDPPISPFVISGERFDELLRRERRIAGDILAEGIPL